MNILITGVHGFVGSNLVKYLLKGNTIYGLDIVQPQKDGVKCTFSWDALDQPNAMPQIDAIIHLAGKAHDTRNKSAADVYFKVNTDLTKKIFDWYLACPFAKKFIFFSTAKAAAECVPEVLFEDVTPTPKGPYGQSKIKAEEYIIEALEKQGVSRASMASRTPGNERPANGKEVYIFRPCMIHGPGNKGNLNLLYGVVSKGIPWPLGAFDNRRTFTSVENVCFAVYGVLTQDVPSGIYNMGDDEALSTNELIEVICLTLGRQTHIWRIPKGLMNGMAKIGGWLHLPLNPLRMQKLTENYVSSNAKIKKALGIKRFPVDAREGLKKTIVCFAEMIE
ncbi:MAG: NAD-dependent epimerase/dehydratase family protein [bacterium]|nr:NAD-dependent epimerase/dehydratase family protein [bacterium]MDD7723165.1 NAD-dependent epimerase/dehydratase family protein [bacterium]MDY4101738.1 NAD-dependent epimerase/dehydratase family protein [Parabacteroides sp.]